MYKALGIAISITDTLFLALSAVPESPLRQSHRQATLTLLNSGDFISVFPLDYYLGDSLSIEEAG